MNRGSPRGFALISALWLLVLMSVIASALAWSNRMSVQGMAALVGGAQARYLAEGAVQLVFANLLEISPTDRLLADGEILRLELPGGQVVLEVTDESGKVDINQSEQSMLARLLYSLDVDPSLADALADAIVDFRDPDSLRHLNGAEDDDYASAGLPWDAKDADFTDIGELRKVLGMDEVIFEKLRPHVTLYSRQRGVNPEVAALPVLMAISNESVFSLEDYIEQRRRNHADGLPPPDPPAVDRRFLTRARGVTYNLKALGRTARGQYGGLTTTIRLRRSRSTALIQTLEWSPYLHRGAGQDPLKMVFDTGYREG
ncbi:hypothetical protein E2F43_03100 [Seongchinamella unica]|uniref:T2SS protein K first SAM-like domain-containing protein n=1 Tax=Seongchinamella unica TaxID=2547392 RepID=A0A4R5LUX7_9GAMM|nr:type II secretion system protein GspK [Seongchinamella unica]TDG15236.1 hypothetical protein E2F43_03100 [Seongchinamella unica]